MFDLIINANRIGLKVVGKNTQLPTINYIIIAVKLRLLFSIAQAYQCKQTACSEANCSCC